MVGAASQVTSPTASKKLNLLQPDQVLENNSFKPNKIMIERATIQKFL